MKVAVFGLGYVGSVTAACLADIGHQIVGVDCDEHKVGAILSRRSPFYEPGLDALVERNAAAGRLSATVSAAEALDGADIALICVGTPSERNGNLNLEQLRRVVADIVSCVPANPAPLIVAIRSTVFPGTCAEIVMPAFERHAVRVVSNPEFLREGAAVKDFMEPGLIVVGGDDPEAVRRVADLYRPLLIEPCLVSLRAAEMIKYACNAFHALKIAFANEIGALSERLNVNPQEIMATLRRDVKLNISPAYLKPGFAFGGSCLPKDLRALVYRSRSLDLTLPLLASALPSNQEHIERAINTVLDCGRSKIAVIGLAFKEDTDDLRESPVVTLLEALIGKGCELGVYDPHIQMGTIYGSNRDFIIRAIPHINRLMWSRVEDLLDWAEYVVIAQTPPVELATQILRSGHQVIDLVGSDLLQNTLKRTDDSPTVHKE